jgi:hypothetical protein
MIRRVMAINVGQEGVHVGIDRLRVLPVEALRDPVGAQHRDLHRVLRDAPGEAILLERHVAYETEPLDHLAPGDDRRTRRAEVLLGARERREADAVHGAIFRRDVEASHGGAKALLEIAPPQLAIGDDGEPNGLLALDHVPDGAILLLRELVLGNRAALVPFENLLQAQRRAQAADLIHPQMFELILRLSRQHDHVPGIDRAAEPTASRASM